MGRDASAERDPERELLAAALAELVSERTLANTDLPALLGETGVDKATFERHYASFDKCCVEVWEARASEFLESTGSAFFAGETWRDGMRAAGWTYCRYIQEDRHRARFLIELAFGSELVQASRDFIMDAYAKLIHLGRAERPESQKVPFATAEGVVGMIWEKVSTKILGDEFDLLAEEFPQLIYLTVLPYVGIETAKRELDRALEDVGPFRRFEIYPEASPQHSIR